MYGIAADDSGQYAITDEVIQIFVNDLEQAIRSRLAAKEEGEEQIGAAEDEDDHCIYQVDSFSSRYFQRLNVVEITHTFINFLDSSTDIIQRKKYFIGCHSTQLGL